MLNEKTLRKNIRELFNAGWTNGRVADTLSAADSFGDEFSRSEILEIANEELKVINHKIEQENIDVNREIRNAINYVALKNPTLINEVNQILKDFK